MQIFKEQILLPSLKRQATLYVMLPKHYTKDEKYPLLLMHDGQNLFYDEEASFGVSWGLNDLYENESKKPIIIAGISCANGLDRLDEYNPFLSELKVGFGETPRTTGGKGDQYLHDIQSDVLPYLYEVYSIDKTNITIGGSSMGGHISLYASLMYPHVFKNAICLSNAFWISEKDLVKFIQKNRKKHYGAIYLDTGDSEDEHDFTYLKSNDLVYQALKDKGLNPHYEIIKGGKHHESSWRKRIGKIIDQII